MKYPYTIQQQARVPRLTSDIREESNDILPDTSTHKRVVMKQEGQKFQQYLCAIIASIGALLIGCVLAWTSPALKLLTNSTSDVPVHLTSETQSSWVASWTPIGAIIGALPAGFFANQFGRKGTLIGFTIPWMCMWVLEALVQSVAVLYAARFVSGIIVGLFCAVLPMYVTEIAEDSVRGTLGTLFQLFLTLGILLDYIFGIFESYYLLNYACLGITALFFVLLFFIPESHEYLLKKDQKGAYKSLRRLRGPYFDVDSELRERRKFHESESSTQLTFRTIFTRPNFLPLTLAVGLMLSQQFCGINGAIFFMEKIFVMSGDKKPALSTIVVGIVQSFATLLSSVMVDRAGRKILLIISGFGMVVCLIALGFFFRVFDSNGDISNIKWLPLVSLVGFIICFSLGFGPLPWMMTAELLSPQMKGFGSGVAVASNWLSVSVVTFSFQPLLKIISSAYTFWSFAVITTIATLFIIFFVPETKGKSCQEIQDELAGIKSTASSTPRPATELDV